MHIFKSQVRSVLEYCSTVWHSSLTESGSKDIERIQKAVVNLMMGKNYGGILLREWSSTALFVVKPGQRGGPGKLV